MSLRVIDGAQQSPPDDRRRLAPGAPECPGTLPHELAVRLEPGEALVWWGMHVRMDHRPFAWILLVAFVVLMAITISVPEFWSQPVDALVPPILVLLSPLALVWVRERFAQRAILVTDDGIVDVPRHGEPDRLAWKNLRRVRRDPLTGGLRLEAGRHHVVIPPALAAEARQAVRSQRLLERGFDPAEDVLRWLG